MSIAERPTECRFSRCAHPSPPVPAMGDGWRLPHFSCRAGVERRCPGGDPARTAAWPFSTPTRENRLEACYCKAGLLRPERAQGHQPHPEGPPHRRGRRHRRTTCWTCCTRLCPPL
ncbi:MAG: hypothetical protein MZV70_56070 [Desulfobacterales bacterium]|nr:hypothetical protein [Desulfobacterales bacterium]